MEAELADTTNIPANADQRDNLKYAITGLNRQRNRLNSGPELPFNNPTYWAAFVASGV